MNYLTIHTSANCNVKYFSGLRSYNGQNMENALFELFSTPTPYIDPWARRSTTPLPDPPPTFRNHNCGILLFAQGSEDSLTTCPYAAKFAEAVKKLELGKVWATDPTPNPLHSGKPAVLYMWSVDWTAAAVWWKKRAFPVVKAAKVTKVKNHIAVNPKKPVPMPVDPPEDYDDMDRDDDVFDGDEY